MATITQMRAKALFISPTPALSPLLQAQGIPHMRELGKLGMEFTLLTFEHRDWSEQDRKRAETLRATLAGWGIDWHILRYGRLPFVPNSTIDVFRGAACALKLIRRKGIEVVHCRSYVPAYMCLMLRRLTGIKFIFDMRGFLPDEYVEGGHWTMDCWEYKLAKKLEAKCLRAADAVVVTTRGMRDQLLEARAGLRDEIDRKLTIIPNLADMNRFGPDDAVRSEMRERYGLEDKTVALWLVGGIADWHMPTEVARFFLAMKRLHPRSVLLVLTSSTNVHRILQDAGLTTEDYMAISATPEEVGKHILIGDFGINFCSSEHSASAIKSAEYLASGLPILIDKAEESANVLARDSRTGVVVESYGEDEFERAVHEMIGLLAQRDALAKRCREVAQRNLSLSIAVDLFAEVYRKVLGLANAAGEKL